MGMTPDSTGMSTGMSLLKGGLTGLSQGLANYNNPHPVYDFSGLQPKQAPLVRDPNKKQTKFTGDDASKSDLIG